MVFSVTLKFAGTNSAVLAERRAGVSSPFNSDVRLDACLLLAKAFLLMKTPVEDQSEAYEHRYDAS